MEFRLTVIAIMLSVPLASASANTCVDTGVLGDGWGWDGQQSCRINVEPGLCIDHDGDGWGWNGVNSCIVDLQSSTNSDAGFAVQPTGQTTSVAAGDDADNQMTSPTGPRFSNNANGTFSDSRTGLTWLSVRQCIFEQDWSSAISFANQLSANSSFCNELNDASVPGDWRLPNINELQSLLNYGANSPAFATGIPFTGTWDSFPWGRYWSSTSFVAAPGTNAWIIYADFGQTGVYDKNNVARVFAVRE